MRCFIAIEIGKEAKDYLFNLQKGFKDIVKASWVAKKNLHLTIRFLGEINENKVEEIKKILESITLKKFEIELSDFGVFPNKDFIKILWVSLKPEDRIYELERKVDEELISLSNKDQEFKAHLTLARVKNIKDKKQFLERLETFKIKNIKFKVDKFILLKSELTKDGPKYEILEEYILE